MMNWLGQELNAGDIVYKARRQGNSTSQKVGKILEFKEKTDGIRNSWQVKVEWWAEPGNRNEYNMTTRISRPRPPTDGHYAKIYNAAGHHPWEEPKVGWNELDSLVKLEECPVTKAVDKASSA